MPRLFIAIDLPSDRHVALSSLRDENLAARWTSPEQYHLTVRFLGDVDDETTQELKERLEGIDLPSFLLAGEQIGVFPSRRKPRVLVAHVNEEAGLMALHSELNDATREMGFADDRKPFNPHITVARFKSASPREVRTYLKEHDRFSIEPFAVESFRLYKSELGSEGAVHTVLQEYPLRTAAAL